MKTLTAQQIKTLKKLEWVETDNYFMTRNLPDQVFLDLTDIDLNSLYDSIYLPVSNKIEYYKSSVYKNGEKFFLQYTIFVGGVEWAKGNFAMFVGDLLELYTPKEEQKTDEKEEQETDEEMFLDYFSGFVGERPDGDVIELIKNNCPSFWENVVTDVANTLTYDNLPSRLREECGWNYIDENPSMCLDSAAEKCCEEDIKHFIVNYLNKKL